MKMAVLSDIHGNLEALQAVLEDASTRSIDQIVNLGDILSGPLYPAETANLLMQRPMPTISGNHERQILTVPYGEMIRSDRYAIDHLTPEQLTWIRSLPQTMLLSDDVLLVHGTPASDVECFLETIAKERFRPATVEEAARRADGVSASLILCGHTHIPRIFQLDDGRLIVNPGSVGLPAFAEEQPFHFVVENGSPHARYAIVERTGERWKVDLVAVAYDWEGAAKRAEENDRPDWAKALLTGRA